MQKIIFKTDYTPGKNSKKEYGKMIYQVKKLPDNDFWKFKIFPVKPGLYLTLISVNANNAINISFEINNAPIEFSYFLSGKNSMKIWGVKNRGVFEFQSSPGINVVSSLPNSYGDIDCSSNINTFGVGLCVDPELLFSYLDLALNKIPKSLKTFLEGKSKNVFQPYKMLPAMNMAASQIINSPYTGVAEKLFYESKAIELLALQIDALTSNNNANQKPKLKKKDIEHIHAAREILIKRMDDPPSLVNLARLAGTNEFKLKKGFKQIFNTTTFGFLQDYKMKQALKMIEQGDMNVSEVASKIGYVNISHFIKAYRKQFGVTPGVFLKRVRHGKHVT